MPVALNAKAVIKTMTTEKINKNYLFLSSLTAITKNITSMIIKIRLPSIIILNLTKNQNLVRTFNHFEQVGHRGNWTNFAFTFAAHFKAGAASVNFAF